MAEWSEMMRRPVRDLRIGGRIVFLSGQECALDADMISALTIEEGAGGALEPGCVLSAACTLDFVNDSGQWSEGGELLGLNDFAGATLMPELGAADSGEVTWHPLGVFQVESAMYLEGDGIVRLKGQDSIACELGEIFVDGLSYPQTLGGLWAYALNRTRYLWSGDAPNKNAVVNTAPDWKNASLRTVLGYIAGAMGCFVRIGRDGSLELCRLWDGSAQAYAIDGESYLKLESDAIGYGPVDALRVKCGDDAQFIYYAGEGNGLYTLEMADNPLFQAGTAGLDDLARGLLEAVAGYESASLRFDWRGDPAVGIGSRVEVCDLSGRVLRAVVTRQTLKFDGGFSASCSCDIPQESNSGVRRAITPEGALNAAALTGAVDGALLRVGSVTAEKLSAGSVTAEKLAVGAVDANIVDTVTARIASLTAQDIETDALAAALAAFTVVAAGTAQFDRATVAHLVGRALNLEFGAAEDVFIRNLAVEYAQMVNAAIGNLCLQASDGNYYALDVDASGHVTATPAELSEAEISAGETDSGRVILATGITAERMNTGNMLATYALVNCIDASRIDVDELFAREAFIALLRTGKIVGEKSITMIAGDVDEMQHLIRIEEDGLHVGAEGTTGEVVVDSDSVDIRLSGRKFSSFAGSYVEFGNYQLRRTADGGLAFKMR